MAENEEKIVLTLGEEEVKEEVQEDEDKDLATLPVSDVVAYYKLDDTGLTEEEKQMVNEFSKKIDITETNSILQYGATAQSKVADFGGEFGNGSVAHLTVKLCGKGGVVDLNEEDGLFNYQLLANLFTDFITILADNQASFP